MRYLRKYLINLRKFLIYLHKSIRKHVIRAWGLDSNESSGRIPPKQNIQ